MDDNGGVGTLFWARIRRKFCFFSGYFGIKLLKSFPFLAPWICPLANLPSIKRAGPTMLCPDPAENLILFNHLLAQGT
jgi:hypothetical protein